MNNKMTGLILGAIAATSFNFGMKAGKYPDDYIPLWTEQEGGDISMMLNTDEIARIIPVFSTDIMSRGDDAYHLEVHFSDGKVYKVYEDMDEFMSRVRNARR